MKKEEIFYSKGYRITEYGAILNPKGIEIQGYTDGRGYKRLKLHIGKKYLECDVHRIQAFQKYGELLYQEGIEVRHFNGIKLDNSYNNILIGTHQENMLDIPEAIRVNKAIYATSFMKKHNKEEVKKFYKENGNSYKKTLEAFNISSKGTLHYLLNN